MMIDFKKISEDGPFTIIKWINSAGWPMEYASENILDLTGYQANDFITENINFFDLLTDQDINHIDQQIQTAQSEVREKIKLDKFSLRHCNNNIVWVEEYITIERNELGNVTGYTGYLLNISDRIETEFNLETSRNETRALINALPDTILQISKSGELKQYLEHKDSQDNEIKAEVYLSDIFPADFAALVPQHLESAINNKTISIYEYSKISPNQQPQYFEARFSEKSNNEALIIIRDISERTENEKLIKQAMQDVKNANEQKNQFLSNMSHELRTPLNAIMGFSQLLMSDEKSDTPLAEEIFNAGGHLLTLINDILDIAKIEARKINLSMQPEPINLIVSDCIALTGKLADENNIHFEVLGTIPDISVIVDKTRLTQVLLNLLTNAIKYNNKNGTVSLACEEIANSKLLISVSDTGNGLTENQLDNLFNPFERVGAENSNIEGSGLGLALSKNLIELMQGEIGVESQPGKGSTFWIKININADNKQLDSDPQQAGDKILDDLQPNIDKSPLSILYIEDNPANQRLIQTIISNRTPHQISIAKNGKEGISDANTRSPDIILLDIDLPDMTGYEVFDHFGKDEKTKNIPVIAISANATSHDLKLAQQTGFYQYLTKPIQVNQLLDAIANLETSLRIKT